MSKSLTKTNYFHLYTPPKKEILQKKIKYTSQAGCGKKGEEKEKRVKKLDKKQKQLYTTYLALELEKIKESLARETKLPKTGEWTPNNAQEEQLDLENLYGDYNQKTFNKEAMR
ncbi:hypothetical protein G9A89_014601 [Geosiphon pyriformis]|nr:hypothetical protein G9A89_014601 [Geosiphon pyriformis]